ncbi:protein disulfide isomerase, putative [Trypanosoma cruzi marinkellei]|uniref:protein disulfide-isomerase n=1 Tax=Trypanosoma cruzi marinkellei TaxID=85056 RepID=K2MTZ8_TRYCR|nr:protein disulfide isomerase, putative [Trypanosoma cruzi marinkellei]
MFQLSFRTTSFFLVLLLTVATLASVAHAGDPSVSLEGIMDLTAANFDEHVGKAVPALVEFYAPWCGHCKNMVPEFEKVGQAVKTARDKVLVGKVDATQHRDLAGRFGVNGYPTILFFPAGSQTKQQYTEAREASTFLSFLNRQIPGLNLAVPREHTYALELTKRNFDTVVMDEAKDALVMFYAPWCGHCKKLHPIFERLAMAFKEEKDVVVGKLNADDASNGVVRNRYKIDGYPTLAFFQRGSKSEPQYYGGGRSLEELVDYVNERTGKNRLPSGDLSEKVGVNEEISKILRDMMQKEKSTDEKKQYLEQVKKAAADLTGAEAVHYPRIAEKIYQLGADYVETEMGRIARLKQGDVKGEKRDMLTIRNNILTSLKEE